MLSSSEESQLRRNRRILLRLMLAGAVLAAWCFWAGMETAMLPHLGPAQEGAKIQSTPDLYFLGFVLMVLGGIMGLVFCVRWTLLLRRMEQPVSCQRCGYNLTGNESGICPECGESCEGDLKA